MASVDKPDGVVETGTKIRGDLAGVDWEARDGPQKVGGPGNGSPARSRGVTHIYSCSPSWFGQALMNCAVLVGNMYQLSDL